jgi:hypothetical protein
MQSCQDKLHDYDLNNELICVNLFWQAIASRSKLTLFLNKVNLKRERNKVIMCAEDITHLYNADSNIPQCSE